MWRLESAQGRWHTKPFQFQVDLKRPDLGWTDVEIEGKAFADTPFQIQLPGAGGEQALTDAYVRQADLVATYSQSPDRSVRPQLVWRVLRDEPRFGVELLVSVQTSLLDSAPEVLTRHAMSGELLALTEEGESVCDGEQTWTTPTAILQRPEGADLSLTILVYPSDFLQLDIKPGDKGWEACFRLLRDSLEKGVIRRARMRGIYVPRENDLDYARQCLQELAVEAPPLGA